MNIEDNVTLQEKTPWLQSKLCWDAMLSKWKITVCTGKRSITVLCPTKRDIIIVRGAFRLHFPVIEVGTFCHACLQFILLNLCGSWELIHYCPQSFRFSVYLGTWYYTWSFCKNNNSCNRDDVCDFSQLMLMLYGILLYWRNCVHNEPYITYPVMYAHY